jgi:hypothetical protein
VSELRDTLAAEGGLLAGALEADGGADEFPLAVEAVREGHRLHAGEPRIVTGADPDLALLAGDRLYALGLARLADRGDVEAIAELADIISLCALAQASGDPGLAERVWAAGAGALVHGRGPDHPGAVAAIGGQRGGATLASPGDSGGQRGAPAEPGRA